MNVQRSLLNHRLWLILLALVAWCACAPAGALAQDEEQAEEPAEASDDETAAEEADAEEDEDRYFAVIGARVHTVTGGVLELDVHVGASSQIFVRLQEDGIQIAFGADGVAALALIDAPGRDRGVAAP